MNILLSDDSVLSKIHNYKNPNWIWIDIWEISQYEIQIVITVNEEKYCHMGQHKVIHVCSAQTDVNNDIMELKTYGKYITRLIRKNFKNREVHSSLYYR